MIERGERVLIGTGLGRTEAEALRDVRRCLGGSLVGREILVVPASAGKTGHST